MPPDCIPQAAAVPMPVLAVLEGVVFAIVASGSRAEG
jgi:hypothetical protein